MCTKILDITNLLNIGENTFINFNKIDIGTDYIVEKRELKSLFPRDVFFRNQYILKIIEKVHDIINNKVIYKKQFSKSVSNKQLKRENAINNLVDGIHKPITITDYEDYFHKSITDYIDSQIDNMSNDKNIVILLNSFSLRYIAKNCNITHNVYSEEMDTMFFGNSIYIYKNKYKIFITESLENQIIIMNFKLNINYSDYHIREVINDDVYEYQEEICNFSVKIDRDNETKIASYILIT